MSVFTRAATVAATIATLAGLLGFSSASVAAEIPAFPLTTPVIQPLAAPQVPAQPVEPLASPSSPDAVATPAVLAPDATEDEEVAYPTLAAAIAAQDVAAAELDEQLRCLAGAIYYESRGEPLMGQLAVAEVILNRVSSGRFARSVCGVVTQKAQFSFVRAGRVPTPNWNYDYRTAIAVAKVAMKDAWESHAGEALYFHARRVSPGWSRARIASIGNHVFYR